MKSLRILRHLGLKTIAEMGIEVPQRLGVTTFKTQVCELQSLWNLNAPPLNSPAIRHGNEIHLELEKEMGLATIDAIDETEHEIYAAKLLEMCQRFKQLYLTNNNQRELRIAGKFGNKLITGIIDEIKVQQDGSWMLVDTKTTKQDHVPDWKLRLAYHQLLLYHQMLTAILDPSVPAIQFYYRDFESVDSNAKAFNQEFSERYMVESMNDIYAIVDQTIREMRSYKPRLSPQVGVDYIMGTKRSFYELDFIQETTNELIDYRQQLFNNERPPTAVDPASGFCNYCLHKQICPVFKDSI